jgi:hypothetical protein
MTRPLWWSLHGYKMVVFHRRVALMAYVRGYLGDSTGIYEGSKREHDMMIANMKSGSFLIYLKFIRIYSILNGYSASQSLCVVGQSPELQIFFCACFLAFSKRVLFFKPCLRWVPAVD